MTHFSRKYLSVLVAVSFVLASQSTHGFTPVHINNSSTPALSRKRQGPSILSLVPSQASDLEACAYDLMKESLEGKAAEDKRAAQLAADHLAADLPAKLQVDGMATPIGPLTWCLQKLQGHSITKEQKNSSDDEPARLP